MLEPNNSVNVIIDSSPCTTSEYPGSLAPRRIFISPKLKLRSLKGLLSCDKTQSWRTRKGYFVGLYHNYRWLMATGHIWNHHWRSEVMLSVALIFQLTRPTKDGRNRVVSVYLQAIRTWAWGERSIELVSWNLRCSGHCSSGRSRTWCDGSLTSAIMTPWPLSSSK